MSSISPSKPVELLQLAKSRRQRSRWASCWPVTGAICRCWPGCRSAAGCKAKPTRRTWCRRRSCRPIAISASFAAASEGELIGWLRGILAALIANHVRHYLGTKGRDVRLERALAVELDETSCVLDQGLVANMSSPSHQVGPARDGRVAGQCLGSLAGRLSRNDRAAAFGRLAVCRSGRPDGPLGRQRRKALGPRRWANCGRSWRSTSPANRENRHEVGSSRAAGERPAETDQLPIRSPTIRGVVRAVQELSGGLGSGRAARSPGLHRPASRNRHRIGRVPGRLGLRSRGGGQLARNAARDDRRRPRRRPRPPCRWAIFGSSARSAAAAWAWSTRRCNCRWAAAWR